MQTLSQLLNRQRPPERPRRSRLSVAEDYAALYAIGDVHGRLDLLLALEDAIVADAASVEGNKLIVMLGDYVDRGPESAQLLDHLLRPPPEGFERICLAGNHEEMMLDFLRNPNAEADWLRYGGLETLYSYGVTTDELDRALVSPARLRTLAQEAVPERHVAFIEGLAGMASLPGFTLVHAGIRPGVPLEHQEDEDLLWIRHEFIGSSEDFGSVVVHGHTPIREAEVRDNRVGIDTGAFATGVLSAAALKPGDIRILEARVPPRT